MTVTRWRTQEEARGQRLDRYLARHQESSRNRVQRWIREGHVRVNGSIVKPSLVLEGGECIDWEVTEPRFDARVEPEEGPLEVLLEDEHLLVVNKPAGLVVHPGAGRHTGTLVHRLAHHFPEILNVGGPGRPGIVHRLDKDTTGVLLVARTAMSYQELSSMFAERRVKKEYLTLAYGKPAAAEGVVDAPLDRDSRDRKRMTVVPPGRGRSARTCYRCLKSGNGVSLLSLAIETGRTHQIRVHLKSIRHPIIGDPVYGEARWKEVSRALQPALKNFPRTALHAWRLSLTNPISGQHIQCEAPLPDDMNELAERVLECSIAQILAA